MGILFHVMNWGMFHILIKIVFIASHNFQNRLKVLLNKHLQIFKLFPYLQLVYDLQLQLVINEIKYVYIISGFLHTYCLNDSNSWRKIIGSFFLLLEGIESVSFIFLCSNGPLVCVFFATFAFCFAFFFLTGIVLAWGERDAWRWGGGLSSGDFWVAFVTKLLSFFLVGDAQCFTFSFP